jgi:dTMP kinase
VCKDSWPDLTIWLDLPLEVGLDRAMKRLELDGSKERRFEEESILFHTRVYDGFKSIAANEPDRVKRVDANCSIDEAALKIMERINEAIA